MLARRDLLLAALLVVATFAAYAPVLHAGFVWDDDLHLTGNELVQADDGLARIWLTSEAKDYYPLGYTWFWIQWRLWGADPTPYHVMNVLQHVLASLLLWRLLAAVRIPGAFACGLLFALHPLQVESVAWVVQQRNTLALLLFLASVRAFTRELAGGGRHQGLASLALFVLSLLAKPIAVFWPLVMPLYAAWHAGRHERRHLVTALPFLLASAISGVLTLAFQQAHSIGDLHLTAGSIGGRLAHAAGAWLFYLRMALVPVGQSAIHPPSAVALDQPLFWALALGVVAALGLAHERGRPFSGPLAIAYYTAMLLPVSGFFAVGFLFHAPVAEHWAYAASIAVVVCVVSPTAARLQRSEDRARASRLGIAALALVGLLFGVATHERCRVFRDEDTLFRDVLAGNPRSWTALTILGTLDLERGELDAAESHFEQALAIEPGYWEALHGLAVVYASRGQPARAIPLFEEVLRRRPSDASARINLERAREAARSGR